MSGAGAPPDHNILKPSTLRAWRVATGVAVAFTAFQLVLRTDYGEKDHVFKPVQQWYTSQIDAWLGVDSEIARRLKAPTLSLAAHQQEKEKREQEQSQRVKDVAAAVRAAQGPAHASAAASAASSSSAAPAPAAAGAAGGAGGGGWGKWLKFW